ncbi:MAG: response regulator [Dehalococcoidia bacterium]
MILQVKIPEQKDFPSMTPRRRIMVVDRDRDTHPLLNYTLENEGFDTIVVTGDDNTPALIHEMAPDLVILDSTEGEADDFRELRRIRSSTDVPVIVLTPSYNPEELKKAISLGADDYVRKPFGARLLVARVRAKLRRCGDAVTLFG